MQKNAPSSRLPARSLFASYLLHGAVLFFVLQLSQLPLWQHVVQSFQGIELESQKTYYVVPISAASMVFARFDAADAAGKPEPGLDGPQPASARPQPGTTSHRSNLTAISNPPHPDNDHQTILQPNIQPSAPDLRLMSDIRLPNVLLRGTPAPKPLLAPRLVIRPSEARVKAPASADVAPSLKLAQIDVPLAKPKLELPPPPPAPSAPASNSSDLAKNAGPAQASPEKGQAQDAGSGAAGGKTLLALSTNADDSVRVIGLPAGNRYGAFSMGPGVTVAGPPGGSGKESDTGKGGPGSAGNGNTGSGGNGSGNSNGTGMSGVGNGSGAGARGSGSGGAGGNGNGNAGSGSGLGGGSGTGVGNVAVLLSSPVSTDGLALAGVGSAIFAVPLPPHARQTPWVITAGPTGGGGLQIYGALSCSKINTVFLQMSPANWVLQYCEAGSAPKPKLEGRTTTTVSLPPPLVPPDAVKKFDFHRGPVPPEKAHSHIILKGLIRDDGVVAELRVYRGVQPELDEIALRAFNSWSFLPATRAGKPVTVQVLVGIPASE